MKRRSVIAGLGALGLAGCGVGVRFDRPFDLSDLEQRENGRLGLAVRQGAQQMSWRAAERFTYCSTFKLFLAAATLERVARGEERLDRAVPITSEDMVSHAPVTGPALGGELTIEALCRSTVEISDNPAANILIREMGGLDTWRNWYRSMEDSVTRVDRLEPELNAVGDERDTTTPTQAVANMARLLAPGQTRLTAGHQTLLERWLTDTPTGPNRIKAAAPEGWRVGHKTGTSSQGPINDIGVIWPPEGAPIFVAAYYEGPPTDDFAAGEAVIAEAVGRALEALGHG
ncbi:class A beta-lactamase [Brevundimonas sp.]|uniref:class A beta-lactamase n=1 Tax=Brevundimonas sp. TaxID=1871086 RepID=UPI001D41CBC9|nr:class A beta-lactamase [Brevundimonas sp.]MBA3999728.1 class A beta-lactamase [Brevundimonas sp.]